MDFCLNYIVCAVNTYSADAVACHVFTTDERKRHTAMTIGIAVFTGREAHPLVKD